MQSHSFRSSVVANEQQRCQDRACGRLRFGLNRYCRQCNQVAVKYGHPAARPLRPSLWSVERQAVGELLATNNNHAGLLSALSYLRGWSERASANGRSFKGAAELDRLVRHGVTPLDMLTEAAAFWLWSDRNVHALPDDRARDFALARAVFALAPRPRRITGRAWSMSSQMTATNSYSPKPLPSALAYVGQHLRSVLGAFLTNVAMSIEQQEQQRAAEQAALRAPLRAPEAA
jgi:hypothetical protein